MRVGRWMSAVAVHVALVMSVVPARAGATSTIAIPDMPASCRAFAWVPADTVSDSLGWNQLLSLASCVQDASLDRVSSAGELTAMIDRFARQLAVPTTIYLGAIDQAPGPVQIRAAYQLAMAHVVLAVRARSSLTEPALRPQLEQLLARSQHLAWLMFAIIDRAATADPTLAPDGVTQNMVRSAHDMLGVLPRPTGEDHPVTARTGAPDASRAAPARMQQ